jgi:hypothetical protein
MRNQLIEYRRNKVLELSSKGYNQTEICQKLQLDKSAVSRDIKFLRHEAREGLERHKETFPLEYLEALTGMKNNLKQTLEIGEQSPDLRIKLEAKRIANECYKYIMDLLTNRDTVRDYVKYLDDKVDRLSRKGNGNDNGNGNGKAEVNDVAAAPHDASDKTTNTVF